MPGTNNFKFNNHALEKSEGRLVKAIYFGLNTSREDKNKIAECINRAEYPIHLLKACPVPEHYSIDFCQVTSKEFL